MTYIVKAVSQTEIQMYDFKFLDTSNIDIIDFGERFENYEVQESRQ